jgi:uncharacterized membrane protein YfcA
LIKIAAVITATTVGFTIAGVAGFGGGVVALPVLIWVFGVREAIPILAISQLLSTASRVWLHRDGLNWPVVRSFSIGAVPMAIVGSFIFVSIDTTVLVRILGIMMLLFVVYTHLPIGRNFNMRLWGFAPLGAATGFGSAFLGIPGPFAVVFYLAYGLAASAYIGTSSLGMALIQVPKLIIFGSSGLLTPRVLLLGLGLGAIAAVTAYLGRWILQRIPEKVFPRIITTMLLVSGVILLVRG